MLYILATLIAVAKSGCFSGSYSGFPSTDYDVFINVGSSTTTVTITTNAAEPVGIGFGASIMDGTYAVIVEASGPKEVDLYNSGGLAGYNEIAGANNWNVMSDTTDGGIRTITMSRDNSVTCGECFNFIFTNTRMNIIYAVAFDTVFTGHLFRGGDRLNAIACPPPVTPGPVTPAPVTAAPTTPAPTTPAPTRRGSKGSPAPTTPAPVTPAPVTPVPTRRRGGKSPAPTTLAPTTPMPTRRRKGAAAKSPGKGAMITTTTTAAPRGKSPRTTKTARTKTTRGRMKTTRARTKTGKTPSPTPNPTKGVRTKTTRPRTKTGRTPSPTPMPTEACDCYTTTLVGRQVIGGNKCYKYEVDFCNDDVSTVILGDGNADAECGIYDVMDVITSVRAPMGVSYESYYDDKVNGLKLDGLLSGDMFRVCYDKAVVDGVIRGGFIEYQGYSGDVSCKQSDNLPDLCPTVVSHAKGPGGKAPVDPCSCNTVTLLDTPYSAGESCYRYQVNFCNDNYDTIEMGMGSPEDLCDTKIKQVFTSYKPPSLNIQIGRPFRGDEAKARGIAITDLSDGDMFTLCFDRTAVYDVRQYGTIDFLNGKGREETCPVTDVLFDLCPTNDPPLSAGMGRRNTYPPITTTSPPRVKTTKAARTKTTRGRMKTTRLRAKTTRARTKTGKTPQPTPNPTKGVRTKTTRSRTKTGKTPQPTTAEPTPSPTPMPTEQCDCVSTELISRNVVGSNKCYRYEVDFCNDGINALTLGDGNADVDCGVDFMAVMTELDVPDDVTYAAVYNDKVRGLKLTGLVSGDRFRVCYDKNVVDNTLRAGFIEYFTDSGDFSCKQSNNLPDLCPTVVSNAGSGGAGKTDPCTCNTVTKIADRFVSKVDGYCYRYQVNFCNDNYDSIQMDMGNPEGLCDTKIKSVFKSLKPASLTYQVGRPWSGDEAHARGIAISGLSDGDIFTICFEYPAVSGVREAGSIDFLNPRGREENCPVTDTLFDLCPSNNPPLSAQSVNEPAPISNVVSQFVSKDQPKNTVFESPTMIYIWSALCSALISMAAVFIVYVSCIAPKGGINMIRGYGKVMDSDDDEDESEEETEESTEDEEDEV